VLSVNLEGQHGTLLAGSIVGNLLGRLAQIEFICAFALLVTLGAQMFMIDLDGPNRTASILRWVLYVAAVMVLLFDWQVVAARIRKFRAEYIDHADEPDVANPAKEQFDREHHRSVMLLTLRLGLLIGMIVFSSNVMPASDTQPLEIPRLES
jgi:putative Mn2+ efflux pump MntP